MMHDQQPRALGADHTLVLDDLFPEATRTGSGRVAAASLATDWREVEPGDVYVALSESAYAGQTDDGHQHAHRAASHGASAIVCEQPVPVFDIPTYLVDDSRVALGRLAHALLGDPTTALPVIGVTGTYGKSTVVELLESIFNHAGRPCGKLSSLGAYDGISVGGGIAPVPSAITLANRLSRMLEADCCQAVLEVTSQALSQHSFAGVKLDAVCVTNVSDAHLDLHNTVPNYRAAKRRIFDYLSPTGVTVLNADDPVSLEWLDQVTGPVLTYGLGNQAEITARVVHRYANEQVFLLIAGSESVAVRTTLLGDHHVSNCLAAAAVALSYGIDLQDIAAGLEAVASLPGRMQRIDCGQGFPVFVDVASTPGALAASLRAARQIAESRVICVLGEANQDPQSWRIARHMADVAIGTRYVRLHNDDAGSRPQAEMQLVSDRAEAIALASSLADAGDVVVIVGSQVAAPAQFAESIVDEAELTRELLYQRHQPLLRIAA